MKGFLNTALPIYTGLLDLCNGVSTKGVYIALCFDIGCETPKLINRLAQWCMQGLAK